MSESSFNQHAVERLISQTDKVVRDGNWAYMHLFFQPTGKGKQN